MKILWVKPGKLLPLDSGGKLRTYHILRQLASDHQLTYFSYYEGARDAAYETEVLQQFPGTIALASGSAEPAGIGRGLDYLRRLVSPAPYAVSRFTHRRVRATVNALLEGGAFDVAVCDFLASAPNFPKKLATPTVLFQHNVEALLWQRRAELEDRWQDRMIARLEYAKMRRYEPSQVRRFDHVIAVSEQDKAMMSSTVGPARITVVPTGVDLASFRYDPAVAPSGPHVIFTGSMDWNPNVDGVEYFCREIWPSVLARVPDARFQIVGRRPHPRVQRLASASVEVTGTVPSVVDYLRQAAVFVVPLRIGGGTRIKLYEGMAMGKATVSTTIGAEGLDVQHGRDIRLADAPGAFADAVVEMLQDDDVRRRYEAAAAATARQYDWSVIGRRFADVLQRTAAAARANATIGTRAAPARA